LKGKEKVAKFKVGDWGTIKGSMLEGQHQPLTKVHVLEVTTHLCEAGIEQTTYLCRIFVKDLKCGWMPSTTESIFREIEIEPR